MTIMEYPKFIITADGHLRLGMVTLHRHLLEPGDTCLGGGYYDIDYLKGELVLSGASADYGSPQWSRLDTILLPQGFYGMNVVYRSGGYFYPIAEQHSINYY